MLTQSFLLKKFSPFFLVPYKILLQSELQWKLLSFTLWWSKWPCHFCQNFNIVSIMPVWQLTNAMSLLLALVMRAQESQWFRAASLSFGWGTSHNMWSYKLYIHGNWKCIHTFSFYIWLFLQFYTILLYKEPLQNYAEWPGSSWMTLFVLKMLSLSRFFWFESDYG